MFASSRDESLREHIELLEQQPGVAGVTYHSLLFSETAVLPMLNENNAPGRSVLLPPAHSNLSFFLAASKQIAPCCCCTGKYNLTSSCHVGVPMLSPRTSASLLQHARSRRSPKTKISTGWQNSWRARYVSFHFAIGYAPLPIYSKLRRMCIHTVAGRCWSRGCLNVQTRWYMLWIIRSWRPTLRRRRSYRCRRRWSADKSSDCWFFCRSLRGIWWLTKNANHRH
jgi:hypothetical protein